MKYLLVLMVLLVSGQASSAGRWQGIKQRVFDGVVLRLSPLSQKVVGGIAIAAVGTTLLTAPLSDIDAHNRFAEAARETRLKMSAKVGGEISRIEPVEMITANQFYDDLQLLRGIVDLELLGAFEVFDPMILAGNVERLIDHYEDILQLRRENSRSTDYLVIKLWVAVRLQYNAVRIFSDKLKGERPSADMIPSHLENFYLRSRADLWHLTDRYVLQIVSRDDYLAQKREFLTQVKKVIDAKKRHRIRSMTRTSRFGGYRK